MAAPRRTAGSTRSAPPSRSVCSPTFPPDWASTAPVRQVTQVVGEVQLRPLPRQVARVVAVILLREPQHKPRAVVQVCSHWRSTANRSLWKLPLRRFELQTREKHLNHVPKRRVHRKQVLLLFLGRSRQYLSALWTLHSLLPLSETRLLQCLDAVLTKVVSTWSGAWLHTYLKTNPTSQLSLQVTDALQPGWRSQTSSCCCCWMIHRILPAG
mmetsp:Transcript_1221/g.3562  ORF Transcript_1221/g.3562 Transcript_1221/m.3562 type:complete len:212 (-) Transcript_1221:308-943(-)